MEVELSLKIRLEQDWMEADQQFRILLFISVLDALVFLGKELEKHNLLKIEHAAKRFSC